MTTATPSDSVTVDDAVRLSVVRAQRDDALNRLADVQAAAITLNQALEGERSLTRDLAAENEALRVERDRLTEIVNDRLAAPTAAPADPEV